MSETIPKGWKKVKLGDLIKNDYFLILNNKRAPLSDLQRSHMKDGSLYPYYGATGVIDYINQYKFDGFYLLIAEDGTVTSDGKSPMLQLVKGKFWVSNHAHVIQGKEEWQTMMLYYMLKNIDINPYITGAVQPKLSKSNLLLIDILLPPLEEQKAIASVLSSLDDKIDLLHRQNQTLEKMAETLFRKWFIEDAKEEWEEVKLGEILDIGIGRTPPRKEFHWFSNNNNDIKWISVKDLGENGVFIFNTTEYLTIDAINKFKIPIIPKDTVVLSFKMTVGRVGITAEEMVSNEAIAHFKFKSNTPITKEYLFFFLKLFKYQELGSTSTIVTSINTQLIKEMKIAIPDKESISKFKKITEVLFNKIFENQQQIRTLEKLRNTLLPKLMSGEVRVKM